MKWIIISILLIDSMIGLILELNELSNLLCLLNSIILPIVLITSGKNKIIEWYLLWLGIIIYIGFSTYNILIWYISFELVLIPMIYLISKGGGSIFSKSRALFLFQLYTILGGLILILTIMIIIVQTGELNYWYYILNNNLFNFNFQIYLFNFSILPYLIKLPVLPFHLWLPETHGEASTSGSVYLAAILLKLALVGIIRWLIPIFPIGYLYNRPLILILGIISSVYTSIICFRHIDLKKLIAYSSISHMGLILIGLTNLNKLSLYGLFVLLISHGLVSSLLFLLIGIIYVRTNTRYIYYYKGLANIMPLFSTFMLISLLLNASLPPSLSYFAELHILLSQFNYEFFGILHVLISLFFAGIYSILLFCKICFTQIYLNKTQDITLTEFYILIPLILLSFSLPFVL